MDKEKKVKIMKKYPKPWGQKEHDEFMKDTGMSEEDHKAWHDEHGGWHGKNKDN